MTPVEPERIAIIGGGFCGAMTAANLARLTKRPIHITIINQHRPTGRGVAFGTRRVEHLLNVAARNMSAFPDMPDHFLQWLRTRSEYDTISDNELREKFIPRIIYGDYLRAIMHQQLHFRGDDALATTTVVAAEALDVTEDNGVTVHLSDGGRIEADRLVLATGNEAPGGFPGSTELEDHPAWIGNPWQSWETRLPPTGGTIVFLGTGLTTVDGIITLRAMGWQGLMHAVSRNGWLPRSHFRGIEYPEFPPEGIDLPSLGLTKLRALLDEHCARLRDLGASPAIIIDKLRPYTQKIWEGFTLEERKEFARNHSARWNVLRHRIAPEIHAQVTTAQLIGQLRIHTATIQRVTAEGSKARVHLSDGKSLVGDLIVNATGPQSRFSATRSVLLANLLRRGLVAPDEMDMGVRVDPDHTVMTRDAKRSKTVLALGPLLRGTLWESIAVPELRGQALRVAETVLKTPTRIIEQPIMMEYMI